MAPYQIEPTNSVIDTGVQATCLMFASQTGKTEIGNNVIGFFMQAQPSAILVVQPTVELGEAWSKERLDPMIRDTPCLRERVKDPRSRDSGNTIMRKIYPGGNLVIVGANAPSGLAGRPRRVLFFDEIDRAPESAGTEGDPFALAVRRTEAFWNAVILVTSTPTVKEHSRIEKEFNASDQRRWFCPCPRCGEHQTLKWSQVKWDEDKPETARYVCEHCAAELTDAERIVMVRGGEWRATARFRGKRGYHLNGICSLFRHKKGFANRLHQMAQDFLDAKATGKQGIKTWVNTFLAETYGEEREKIEMKGLINQRETYTRLPNTALVMTAGVDIQKDRFEVTCYAWGVGEESWGVFHRVIYGRVDTDQPWVALDELLAEKWEREDGTMLQINRSFVDSGNWQDHTLAQCKKRTARGVFASKGSSTAGLPVLSRESRSNKGRVPQYLVGTDTAKGIIMDRLRMAEAGPGFYHFTDHPQAMFNDSFFQMLTAEEVEIRKVKGRPVRVWVPVRPRNEALDCTVYALAALYHLNCNWKALAVKLAPQAESESSGKQPEVVIPEQKQTVPTRTYALRPAGTPIEPNPAPAQVEQGEPTQAPSAVPARPRPRFGPIRRGLGFGGRGFRP